MENKITIKALIETPKSNAWEYYTNPIHIVNWNFADPSWHCPSAENDMIIGGKYKARMEAKDGSFGFDFEATYKKINSENSFEYEMPDARNVLVQFKDLDNITEVIIQFDPEQLNPKELQQQGWQAILNQFKTYAESI